jgi:hypothetical protein
VARFSSAAWLMQGNRLKINAIAAKNFNVGTRASSCAMGS